MALALIRIVDTNPLRVSYRCVRRYFTVTIIESSCTSVARRHASVIKVGVAYMNVHVSRYLKEELAWVIDKQLRAISTKMLFKTVLPLRN